MQSSHALLLLSFLIPYLARPIVIASGQIVAVCVFNLILVSAPWSITHCQCVFIYFIGVLYVIDLVIFLMSYRKASYADEALLNGLPLVSVAGASFSVLRLLSQLFSNLVNKT